MRTCPRCKKIYRDDLNYCLEDGAILIESTSAEAEKTLSYAVSPMSAAADGNQAETDSLGGRSNRQAERKTERMTKSKFFTVLSACLVGLVLTAGVFGFFWMKKTRLAESGTDDPLTTDRSIVFTSDNVKPPPIPVAETEAKIEIGERVKDNFGRDYIKCLMTNVGTTVIEKPSVRLNFYKNDLKVSENSGFSEMDYLKPEQTIPIWVWLSESELKSTVVRVDESDKPRAAEKDAATLYPTLVYSNAKMTGSKETALLNYRPILETYYTVAGTVENRLYDKIEPLIYVLFYDRDGDVIGIVSTRPPSLRKNEKSEFTASIGTMGLFGTPERFELIAVNDE